MTAKYLQVHLELDDAKKIERALAVIDERAHEFAKKNGLVLALMRLRKEIYRVENHFEREGK